MSSRLRGVWTRMTQRIGRRRGVTLVEMLATTAIIGLTVTFFSPQVFDFADEQALSAETRSFSRMLALARSEAVSSRRFVALALELQAYPEPDHVVLLKNASWDADNNQWIGEPVGGYEARLVEGLNDVRSISVGNTSYFVGSHAIVFSPAGAAGFDDGSVIDEISIDIVRMDG